MVFDGDKFLKTLELVLLFPAVLAFVYLEQVKNFERFNIDQESRDYLLKA